MQSLLTRKFTRRVLLSYSIFAAVWVIVSNTIIYRLTVEHQLLIVDDLLFVSVNGFMLIMLLVRMQRDENASQIHLQETEERFRAVFERSGTGIIIVREGGDIQDISPAALLMIGYTANQAKARNLGDFYHPEDRGLGVHLWEELRAGRRTSYQIDRRMHKSDGSVFWARLTVSLMPDVVNNKHNILVMMEDVTERIESVRLLEERVAERTRELETLLDASTSIASTLELEPLYQIILKQLRSIVDYDEAVIMMFDGTEAEVVAHITLPDEKSFVGLRYPLASNDRLEQLTQERRAIFGTIVGEPPRIWQQIWQQKRAKEVGWRSWISLPLIVQDETIGVLGVRHYQPDVYTQHHANLVTTFGNQAAIAVENARLVKQLEKAATDAERQRLARDLHDAVTQTLFSANLIAEVLPQMWTEDPQGAERRLQDLRRMTRGALAEMRALLMELRPATLLETPLADLLRQVVEAALARSKVELKYEAGTRTIYPAEIQTMYYRVAQEAINNIIRHSKAKQGWLELRDSGDGLELEVRDNGKGFDPALIPADHFGVRIMHERAAAAAAKLQIESTPGIGTTIRLVWHKQSVQQLNAVAERETQ
ncbi:MAG: PAS domain S-box protein [Anaerolineae bacterium]